MAAAPCRGGGAIDPTDTNVLYAACNGLSIGKSTNGGSGFSSAQAGIPSNESVIFIPPFALDLHQLRRRDVIAVVRRIVARVAAAHHRLHHSIVALESSEQCSAALVRIGLLPVCAHRFVLGF